MTDIQDGSTLSTEEAHLQENPQTVNHSASDHSTQLGCEFSQLEPAEDSGSWDALFDDDPLAFDEHEVPPDLVSVASPEEFRETKRARTEITSAALTDNSGQSVFDSRAWEAMLRDSLASRLKTRAKFPWETGYMAQVFNKSFQPCWLKPVHETPSFGLPPLPMSTTPIMNTAVGLEEQMKASRESLLDKPGIWPIISHRVSQVSFWDREEATRNRALQWMKLILLENLECSSLGRTLVNDILAFQSEDVLVRTIQDVFASRATATLRKRSKLLLKFKNFCNLAGQRMLPVSEQMAYRFLFEQCGTSPSAPQSFREALMFVHGTLGADGAQEAANSPRIVGRCFAKLVTKAPLKQSRVLSAPEVMFLEQFVTDQRNDPLDRLFAGHAIFCIHGRLRWSDSLWILNMTEDLEPDTGKGFLQCETLITKTATSAKKKSTFLPATVLACGLTGTSWYHAWLQLRADFKLNFGPKLASMRTVRPDGSLSDKPLDSADATKWLQELLLRGDFQKAQVCRVTSHGLKATALSWAAKWGLGREQRQILGYHIVEGASSALHYSRDEQSAPLRALERVYESIRDGSFNPDATRSGYFRKRGTVAVSEIDSMITAARQIVENRCQDPELQEGGQPHPLDSAVCAASQDELSEVKYENLHQPDEILMVAESTTSDSDSSSSDSSGEVEGVTASLADFNRPVVPSPPAPSEEAETMYIHKRFGTQHRRHRVFATKLVCGRPLHQGFVQVGQDDGIERPLCKGCFGHEQ